MSDTDSNVFQSGSWTGYYLYSDPRDRHRMDLDLTFANGNVSGAGSDDIGAFSIRGTYDTERMNVVWRKSYVGRHTVVYSGCLDGQRIWGTWELLNGGWTMRGGFKIWPKGKRDGVETSAEAEVGEPVLATLRARR